MKIRGRETLAHYARFLKGFPKGYHCLSQPRKVRTHLRDGPGVPRRAGESGVLGLLPECALDAGGAIVGDVGGFAGNHVGGPADRENTRQDARPLGETRRLGELRQGWRVNLPACFV